MSSISTRPGAFASGRPARVTWAVVIIVAVSVLGPGAFFLPGTDEIPAGAIAVGISASIITIALSWFVWNLKRWAVIGVSVVNALNLLSSLPGLIEPPSNAILAVIIAGIPLTLVPLWLLWHPDSRKAYR